MPWWIIVLGIAIIIILYGIVTYNKLISLKNRVKDQWSQIDVQLKRRFDLIPNIVSTVKGYAKHEKETLEEVIQARNTFVNASTKEEEMQAENALAKGVSKLFALAESYPDLKANQNFIDLQASLKETENKIASARQFYNDTVLNYNDKIQMFPSNLIASLFHFKSETFFEAKDQERENVNVEF